MTDEEALLAAICADPADDLARLVFADFLQERGGKVEIAWAALIRAQVRGAAGLANETDATRARMFSSRFWLGQYAVLLGVPAQIVDADPWERGFPQRVCGDYTDVHPVWPKLIKRAPIKHLAVRNRNARAVVDTATWPQLDKLQSLELTTLRIGIKRPVTLAERAVTAICECSALTNLDSLVLGYVDVTEGVADLILDSPYLTKLRSLRLIRYGFSDPTAVERLRERFETVSTW